MSEWIKIEDKKPECDCLVYLEDDGRKVCKFHVGNFHRKLDVIGNHFHFDMPKVTHWMPLPEPPTD